MPISTASLPARIADVLAGMAAEGTRFLDSANVPPPRRALLRLADVRYRRQAYELTVPIADGADHAARRWRPSPRRFMRNMRRPTATPTAPSRCSWSICG